MGNAEKKLEKVQKEMEHLGEIKERYIEKVENLNKELSENKDEFYSNSIKADILGGCLYKISQCEKKIKKLEKLEKKLVIEIRKKSGRR